METIKQFNETKYYYKTNSYVVIQEFKMKKIENN